MNASSIDYWNADAVPLQEIEVSIDWEIDIDVTKEFTDSGFTYDEKWTESGTGNVTFAFLREDPLFDGTSQTVEKFIVTTGDQDVSIPSGSNPFFRSCYATITTGDVPLESTPVGSYSVNWTHTYAATDGGPPITPPGGTSGTTTGDAYLTLEVIQIGKEITFSVALVLLGLKTGQPYTDFDGTFDVDDTIGPVTVTVHDLKTDPGGDVDIGGGPQVIYEADTTGSTFWDLLSSYVDKATATITCS